MGFRELEDEIRALQLKQGNLRAEMGTLAGQVPVGTHLPGEWAAAALPGGFVLANGAVHPIATYPKLAAHYAAVYGTANHHGGNGTTTFAVPDSRERVYVNQGGSDVFATLSAKPGAKNHTHPLSAAAYALIAALSTGLATRRISTPSWIRNIQANLTGVTTGTATDTFGTELGGDTDSASNIQPSFVCRFIIRAE